MEVYPHAWALASSLKVEGLDKSDCVELAVLHLLISSGPPLINKQTWSRETYRVTVSYRVLIVGGQLRPFGILEEHLRLCTKLVLLLSEICLILGVLNKSAYTASACTKGEYKPSRHSECS